MERLTPRFHGTHGPREPKQGRHPGQCVYKWHPGLCEQSGFPEAMWRGEQESAGRLSWGTRLPGGGNCTGKAWRARLDEASGPVSTCCKGKGKKLGPRVRAPREGFLPQTPSSWELLETTA